MLIDSDRRSRDPRKCHVAIDTNALHKDGSVRDGLVDRLLDLSASGHIQLIAPKGVRLEGLDPRTPLHVQTAITPLTFTYQVGLNLDEQRRKRLIEKELQGKAQPGKHAADADHLFEAEKYCSYFITHDRRILDKAGKMRSLLRPSLTVVTLAEFLEIFENWTGGMHSQS